MGENCFLKLHNDCRNLCLDLLKEFWWRGNLLGILILKHAALSIQVGMAYTEPQGLYLNLNDQKISHFY
jgi:hypothetical protein